MTGFFNLLLGMIDLPALSWALSTKPEYQTEIMAPDALYGVTKGQLDDHTWKALVNTLCSNTFKELLDKFISSFVFPNELRQQMIDIYGIDETKANDFNIDPSKIKLHYCYELINASCQDEAIILVRIEMVKLSSIVLDPCITMLISTYYQALVHYITFSEKYSNISTNFFHNPETCSPWIEELFCLAFNEVLGDCENGNSCRASRETIVDRLSPAPAYILKSTAKTAESKTINNPIILDSSIVCKRSDDPDIKAGAQKHLYSWRNRIPAYVDGSQIKCHTHNLIYIDTLYGYSYDHDLFAGNTILYGATDLVPAPLEWLLNDYCHDWLRVPFIKVPRFQVSSPEELYNLMKAISGFGGLFRGQSSEYNLNRSLPLMKKLYDDENAIEPSLASYAVRKNVMFEKHYVEWSTIIKSYLYSILGNVAATDFLSQFDDFNYYLLCLSIAQHYGLPTYGLDVSTSISAALFFAFYQFTEVDANTRKFKYIKKDKGTSIIYVLSPRKGEFFNYDRFDLHYDIFPRPLMQNASFAHCSWGYAKNAIAERLIAAIQFDVELIEFSKINQLLRNNNESELYERNFFSHDDSFIDFLRKYIANTSDKYNKAFKEYLKKYIYQI